MTLPKLPRPLRALFHTPLVTLVAITSLALGIGANAAIFSLFDQMLLRPLPVPAPGELVNLSDPGPKPGSNSTNQAGNQEHIFSYPMLRDLEREQRSFTGIAGHRSFQANLAYKGQTISDEGMLVSGSYFPVLGLKPALGRLFGPDDDRTPGAHRVVVLGYRYWETRFEASASVLGETLVVNGQPLTIIGVSPKGFEGTTLGQQATIYVPISMRGQMQPMFGELTNRQNYWVYLFARLRPGVSMQQAQAALSVSYRAIINEVDVPLQKGLSPQTLDRFKKRDVRLAPGARGQSGIHREAKAPLILLLSITGLVLLIACANIANLLLARGVGRSTEMAVRLSIGAGRAQLVKQLLVESCILAGFGGLAGLLVARWTLALIASMLPADAALTIAFALDARAVLFAAVLSVLTGLLFGLFPALHASRPNLVAGLKGNAAASAGGRATSWFRMGLATGQIFLSMTLLITAGLFTKSLLNVARVDLGIKTDHMVVFNIAPVLNGYKPEQSLALFERLETELATLPGVKNVSSSMVPLIAGSSWGNNVTVQGFKAGPDTDTNSMFNEVGPTFFRTTGTPLLAGREFTQADAVGTPKVAVVNEAFARKFNLGRQAVGKRMKQGGGDGELDIEIVGLVQDTKYADVKRAAPPIFFLPYRQDKDLGFLSFCLRTSLPPEQVVASVPAAVKRLDPNLPVDDLRTMQAQVEENVSIDRMITTLAASFAILATLLAAVGLYGVIAYTVSQRTREIGLRVALGAAPGDVRRLVLRSVAWMTGIGGVLGVGAAFGLGRLAKSLLFEVQSHDPAVFALSVLALTAVAVTAGFIPAYRAAKIDPMRALRYE